MTALLAYLFYFAASSGSTLQRRWLAVHRNVSNTGQLRLAFQSFAFTAVLGLFIPFFVPFQFSGDVLKIALLSLMAGVAGAGFFWASYTAQRHVEAGVTTILGNLNTPVAIFFGTLFLGEGLAPIQLLGTAFLLAGIIIVSQKHRIGRFAFDRYFWMMVASGVLLGLCLVAERALQKETGFTAGTLFSWWAQLLCLGIAVLIEKGKHSYTAVEISVTGILRFFQSLSWVILIFVVGNLSLVASITTFKVVVVMAAAALFLGERDYPWKKLLGSAIALAGLLLMK